MSSIGVDYSNNADFRAFLKHRVNFIFELTAAIFLTATPPEVPELRRFWRLEVKKIGRWKGDFRLTHPY
jgi:hypothetical protein